jgi:hypothetical protein
MESCNKQIEVGIVSKFSKLLTFWMKYKRQNVEFLGFGARVLNKLYLIASTDVSTSRSKEGEQSLLSEIKKNLEEDAKKRRGRQEGGCDGHVFP